MRPPSRRARGCARNPPSPAGAARDRGGSEILRRNAGFSDGVFLEAGALLGLGLGLLVMKGMVGGLIVISRVRISLCKMKLFN